MNIVYTINGEGMGHASRSSVVIDHLLAKGHHIAIFSAGRRPLAYLRERFGNVAEVMGLHMVYRENKVFRIRTAFRVLANIKEFRKDFATIRRSLVGFRPHAVITDFDFHGKIVATMFHVPIISIDNVQFITQAHFRVLPEDFVNYEINYLIAKMMVPHADYCFVTTFARAKPREGMKPIFVPPLLRQKVLATRPRQGQHILVYQTSDSYTKLLPILAQSKEQFVVYNAAPTVKARNITAKEFNEDAFIQDIATSKAVITSGGFNVITEALYFKKPILSIPIRNFFEQKLNALLLQEEGLGLMVKRLSKVSLQEFINRIGSFGTARPVKFDNTILFNKLDEVLAKLQKRDASR